MNESKAKIEFPVYKSDVERHNLKGKVSQILFMNGKDTTSFIKYNEFGNMISGKSIDKSGYVSNEWSYQYDNRNRIIRSLWNNNSFNNIQEINYVYINDSVNIETKIYNNQTIAIFKKELNKNGLLKMITSLNLVDTSKVDYRENYEYGTAYKTVTKSYPNKKSWIKELNEFDEIGNLIYKKTVQENRVELEYFYSYDENKNVIESKFSTTVPNKFATVTYDYEYDMNGNWIRKNGETRKVIYY